VRIQSQRTKKRNIFLQQEPLQQSRTRQNWWTKKRTEKNIFLQQQPWQHWRMKKMTRYHLFFYSFSSMGYCTSRLVDRIPPKIRPQSMTESGHHPWKDPNQRNVLRNLLCHQSPSCLTCTLGTARYTDPPRMTTLCCYSYWPPLKSTSWLNLVKFVERLEMFCS
jgi:hypothetical protein